MDTIYKNIDDIIYPSPALLELYQNSVDNGIQYLAQQKILILGLVRNLEPILEKNISKLVELGSKAKEYKILLFENDSIDNTKTILSKLQNSNPNIIVKTQDFNRKQYGPMKSQERTEALAEYRNILLELVKHKYSDYDYTIVSDTDFIDFSLAGCYNSFGWIGKYADIDALAGNSFQIKSIFSADGPLSLWNYDSWAYRPTWWNYSMSSPLINYDPTLWFGLWVPPVGSSIFLANSAFGGMTIYKTQMFTTGRYSGYDCEHVTFHYSLQKNNANFKLYLNPSQVMLME